MTRRGRPTTFTRLSETGKAATVLNFGRCEKVPSLLTAREADSKLFARRVPRLPGTRRFRALQRARLPMRRSASRECHIHNRVQISNDVVGISGWVHSAEGRRSYTISAVPKFRDHRVNAGPLSRGRASEHQPCGRTISVHAQFVPPEVGRRLPAQSSHSFLLARSRGRRFSLLPEEG